MKAAVAHQQAIGFALMAFTLFVLTDTSIKFLGGSGLPAYEIVAFLGLFMVLFLGAYAVLRGNKDILRPHRIDRQAARGCLDLGNNLGVVIALRHLSLTLFYILVFTAPIVISTLSLFFLRERVTWRRALAILAGFCGVVVAVAPWREIPRGSLIGFAACALCVSCFSINMVWSRVLTRTETPESLAFFSGLISAGTGLTLMAFHAAPLTPRLVVILFAMGLFCAAGTLCFYTAVKHTSASNVAQYHYTQLVTGSLLSFLIWHDKPTVYILLGAVLILASGLYIAITVQDLVPLTEGN